MRLKKLSGLLFVLSFALFTASCDDNDEELKIESSEKSILEFAIDGMDCQINEAQKTITISIPHDADVTKLKPSVKVSDKATVTPASDTETDFTNPVEYTVTAEDGSTVKYTATAGFDGLLAPSAYSVDGNETISIEYNDEAKLISIKTNDGEAVRKISFGYDNEGRIADINNENTLEKSTFVYDGNTIWVTAEYYGDADYTWTTGVVVDKDGKALKSFLKNSNDTTYCYYDDNNRLVKTIIESKYGDETDLYEKQYGYDSRKGQISNVNIPLWLTYYLMEDMGFEFYFLSYNNNLTEIKYTNSLENELYDYTAYNRYDLPIVLKWTEVYTDNDNQETTTAIAEIKYTALKNK